MGVHHREYHLRTRWQFPPVRATSGFPRDLDSEAPLLTTQSCGIPLPSSWYRPSAGSFTEETSWGRLSVFLVLFSCVCIRYVIAFYPCPGSKVTGFPYSGLCENVPVHSSPVKKMAIYLEKYQPFKVHGNTISQYTHTPEDHDHFIVCGNNYYCLDFPC